MKGIVYAWMGLHQDVFLYFYGYKFAIQLFKWHCSKNTKITLLINVNISAKIRLKKMIELIPLNISLMQSKHNMFVQWRFQDE